jgi:multidrug efflux pump subunit AcrA (membrane-fusion protein)
MEGGGAPGGNAVVVVAAGAEAERVRRVGKAAVWVRVATVPELAAAPAGVPVVVIGDPDKAIDDRVAHVVRPEVPDDQLQALLTAVATGQALAPAPTPATPHAAAEARRAQAAFAVSRKLAAATDLASTEAIAVDAIIELLDVERAHCLFYDAGDASLWSEARLAGPGDERRAVAGLAGWVARTGLPARAPVAGDDPRWALAYDDPGGDRTAQLLVQPVIGADARVHAVLVAARAARRAPLAELEASLLERFAALAAPLFDQLSVHVEAQALLADEQTGGLFREEAIAAAEPRRWGDVIRVTPTWLSWAYWLLVLLVIGSVAFVAFGTVATYSSGTAVIRSTARTDVTTRAAGNVTTVEVAPSEHVAAGAVIARLDDVAQRAAVDRTTQAFDAQLRNHMLDPGDPSADAQVRSLRLQLEQTRTALDERAIRAPSAGVVSDLRVRPGQHVEPGQTAATLVEGAGGLEVIALLPGEDRPQLSAGMPLRLELVGYRYAYQSLIIDSVSPDVLAPSEAVRVVGPEVAALQLAGPVVVVRGRLASKDFVADDRTYHYHDGMLATAEVRVRSEPIIFAILPGLKRWAQ